MKNISFNKGLLVNRKILALYKRNTNCNFEFNLKRAKYNNLKYPLVKFFFSANIIFKLNFAVLLFLFLLSFDRQNSIIENMSFFIYILFKVLVIFSSLNQWPDGT